MGSVSVPYREESCIRFQAAVASTKVSGVSITISTDLVGTGVNVTIGDAQYRVDLADVATAIIEAERPDLVPTPTTEESDG